MRRRRVVATLLLAVAVGGVALGVRVFWISATDKVKARFPEEARAILEKPGELEVLALVCERKPTAGEAAFHGYPVTKRVPVPAWERALLVKAIYEGVDGAASSAKCFEPHHGLHATQGEKVVDVVICFECSVLETYSGGQCTGAPTTDAAKNLFARILGE